jgi:hypothetical protein
MGFRLNVDLETSAGPTQEAYIRIDNYRFNKVTSELILTTTTWLDVEKAHSFNRKYLEQPMKNAVGLIGSEMLYYPDVESEGEEISIPNVFKHSVAVVEEVEFHTYKEVEKLVQVPYVSFNYDGEEVTKYKDEIVLEREIESSYKEKRSVINPSVITNLYEYSYNVVKQKLTELFPEETIEKI